MAAPIILISSDASDESVGLAPSRIILFGTISAEIPTKTPVISPVAPMVETTIVASPTGLPTSPFIFTDSSETSRDSSDGPPSQDPYEVVIARWRSKAIPFGRPYRTHPNGPWKVMTARKRVGPLPARRLAWRRVSPCSSHHYSSSGSSSDASPARASGHPTPDQSLSGYSSPATTIEDSPAPPRFVYPSIVTPRDSEAYRHWRYAPLSTMCPPTISESSFKDLSFESYAGSSRKRCRSPTVTMPLHISASGALVPTRAGLILPRKRFRDSYLSEESIEEDIDDGVGIEFDTGIGMGVEVAREDRIGDIEAGLKTSMVMRSS
ncbi:hypothetical protein Tco_1422156 [Tanacetum coccineum]